MYQHDLISQVFGFFFFCQIKVAERYILHTDTIEKYVYLGFHGNVVKVLKSPWNL